MSPARSSLSRRCVPRPRHWGLSLSALTAQATTALERWTADGNAAEAQRCSDLLQPVTAALAAGDKSLATLGAASAALGAALAAAPWDVQDEYLTLARRFEREFFDDMDALGVQRPDVVTRVSEFVPQVVTYIQAIIDKGAGQQRPKRLGVSLRRASSQAWLTNHGAPCILM